MHPLVLTGSASPPLSADIVRVLAWDLGQCLVERFPDGELHVEVCEEVRARDVYLVQSLAPPAESHLMELLLLADAARRAGAERLTAVVPYLAYARQDRRKSGLEPLSARVVADLLQTVGFDRVVALDLHSEAVEGAFRVPLERLSAMPVLVEHLKKDLEPDCIVVSPDMGGIRRAESLAQALALPLAIVHKSRLSGSEVEVRGIVGEVRGMRPIIIDDMVTTAGTLEATVQALRAASCAPDITAVATHGLLVGQAFERIQRMALRRFVTTNSLAADREPPFPIERVNVAPVIAQTLRRLHASAR